MLPEQLAEIRKTQKVQEDERKQREQAERHENEEWEKQANNNAKAGMILEREQGRQVRNKNKNVAEENLKLANKKRTKSSSINKCTSIPPRLLTSNSSTRSPDRPFLGHFDYVITEVLSLGSPHCAITALIIATSQIQLIY